MIDTRDKRASSTQIALPFRMGLPLPSGTIAQAQQQFTDFSYSGILAGVPVVPPVVNYRATVISFGGYSSSIASYGGFKATVQ